MFAPPLISGGLAALSAVVAAFYLPQNLSCSTQIRSEQLTSSGRIKRVNGLFSVENHPARTSVSSLQTPLIGGGIVEASEDLMTGKQLLFDPWAYFKFVAKPGLIVLSLLGSSSSYFLHVSFQDNIAKLRLNPTIHNLITFWRLWHRSKTSLDFCRNNAVFEKYQLHIFSLLKRLFFLILNKVTE